MNLATEIQSDQSKRKPKVPVYRQRLPYFLERRIGKPALVQRYFDTVFKKALKSRPLPLNLSADTEVVSLLGKRDLYQYLVAVKSFAYYAPIDFSVTVVSDGSLSAGDKRMLAEHIIGVKIFEPSAESRAAGCLSRLADDARAAIDRAAQRVVYIKKLFDFYDATERPNLVILDADIVFKMDIEGSELRVSEQMPIRYNKDHDHSYEDRFFHLAIEYMRHKGFDRCVRDLNSGFVVMQRRAFDFELMADYIRWVCERGKVYARISQDTWNVVGAKYHAEPMSNMYLVGSRPADFASKRNRANAVMIHYVQTVRYQWSYALEYWRNAREVLAEIDRFGFA